MLGTAEALPQGLLSAVDKAAAVLCERCRFPSQAEADAAWHEAVLTALHVKYSGGCLWIH